MLTFSKALASLHGPPRLARFWGTSSCPTAILLWLLIVGCAALSREPPLPEESVTKIAAAIEQTVLTGAEAGITVEDAPGFKARLFEVVQAMQARQARVETVTEFKQKGYVGEGARGLIKYVKNDECRADARLHDRVANVILSENADRWRIYETLARENRLSTRGRKRIQAIFHQVRIEVARPRELVQLSPGAGWTKKPGAEPPAQ